jgi:hypothetical protein
MDIERRNARQHLCMAAMASAAALCLMAPLAGCGERREYIRTETKVTYPTEKTTVVEKKTTVIKESRPKKENTVWYVISAPFRWLGDLIGIQVI